MKRIEPKHPLPTRIFHWINAPVLAVMIWSGLRIYWANDVYRIGWGDYTLFRFFPPWLYEPLSLDYRLGEGMAWHFAFMWIFAFNGLLYVGYTFASGEWRHLVPGRGAFRNAVLVALHDLGLVKELPPQGRFNAAQQFAYTGVLLMGAGSLLTGLAIYKPTQVAWLTSLLGGYQNARWIHFVLTVGYVLFFVVHITQVIKAGWNNFRAMVTGVETVDVKEATSERAAR